MLSYRRQQSSLEENYLLLSCHIYKENGSCYVSIFGYQDRLHAGKLFVTSPEKLQPFSIVSRSRPTVSYGQKLRRSLSRNSEHILPPTCTTKPGVQQSGPTGEVYLHFSRNGMKDYHRRMKYLFSI